MDYLMKLKTPKASVHVSNLEQINAGYLYGYKHNDLPYTQTRMV